jgi:hypothetical protein
MTKLMMAIHILHKHGPSTKPTIRPLAVILVVAGQAYQIPHGAFILRV